jgi:hypothetical protein
VRWEAVGFSLGSALADQYIARESHVTHWAVYVPKSEDVMDFWHHYKYGRTTITPHRGGSRYCKQLGMVGQVYKSGSFFGTVEDLSEILRERLSHVRYSKQNDCSIIVKILDEVLSSGQGAGSEKGNTQWLSKCEQPKCALKEIDSDVSCPECGKGVTQVLCRRQRKVP